MIKLNVAAALYAAFAAPMLDRLAEIRNTNFAFQGTHPGRRTRPIRRKLGYEGRYEGVPMATGTKGRKIRARVAKEHLAQCRAEGRRIQSYRDYKC